jgi:hypothetical protein
MLRRVCALLVLLWLVSGCSSDPCDAVDGRSYRSTQQGECGLGPGGIVQCNWRLSFDGAAVTWHHSDLVEHFDFRCEDGAFEASGGLFDGNHAGTIDDDAERLTWDGGIYLAEPE